LRHQFTHRSFVVIDLLGLFFQSFIDLIGVFYPKNGYFAGFFDFNDEAFFRQLLKQFIDQSALIGGFFIYLTGWRLPDAKDKLIYFGFFGGQTCRREDFFVHNGCFGLN